MKQYEFIVECKTRKIVTIEANSEGYAKNKMDKWIDVMDEQELEMLDWEIISGPKEV